MALTKPLPPASRPFPSCEENLNQCSGGDNKNAAISEVPQCILVQIIFLKENSGV